jgi:nucleoid DNA-binding protein
MSENKTKATNASIDDYIASRAHAQQHTDCRDLMVLLEKITAESATMWGPSIVGYGSYRYTYESGRTGEAPLTGFAIRGRELVLYLSVDGEEQQALLSRLGKHKMGKSCLYFKQLADLDRVVLEQLIVGSVAEIKQRYS